MAAVKSFRPGCAIQAQFGAMVFLNCEDSTKAPQSLLTISTTKLSSLVELLETAGGWYSQEKKNTKPEELKRSLLDLTVEKDKHQVTLYDDKCQTPVFFEGAREILSALQAICSVILVTISPSVSHLRHINNICYFHLQNGSEEDLKEWLQKISDFPRNPDLDKELYQAISNSFELQGCPKPREEDVCASVIQFTLNSKIILLQRHLMMRHMKK